MGSAVAITRLELGAGELRREAARMRDARAARRVLAIALVLEGHSREEAAKICGMERQTLRDWIHRYNAEGLEGLKNRRPPGPRPRLTPRRRRRLRRGCGVGPIRSATAGWCAGGAATCATRSPPASA